MQRWRRKAVREWSPGLVLAGLVFGGSVLGSPLLGGLALAVARADSDPKSQYASIHPSIHQQQMEAHRDLPVPPLPQPPPHRDASPRLEPRITHEVHGYHPYWMGTAYEDYRWELLTTVAFFGLELDGAGNVIDTHGWPWHDLVATAHAAGVRVLVTATLFSSSQLSALLGDPARRAQAIENLVSAVEAGNADGINVDFENMPGSRKTELVLFLEELRIQLEDRVEDPYLSIATPAVDWTNAFDYDALAAVADHLMIMAYNYHWSGSPTSGPVAPLQGWGAYNVVATVTDYVAWGAPRGKMLLGVPYYGLRWQTATALPGASTLGSANAVLYENAQTGADYYGRLWDLPSSTPWYRYETSVWNQVWYDDGESLGAKYDFTLAEGLGGVGIWALGYDGARPDLWDALRSAFGATTGPPAPPAPEPPLLADAPLIRLTTPHPFEERLGFDVADRTEGRLRLAVYDPTGRRVRTLVDRVFSTPGLRSFTWNGRDDLGRAVPAGTYFLRVMAEGPQAEFTSRRVVKLR